MSVEENKAILRKLHEELNKGNHDIVDETFSPNAIRHIHEGTKDFKTIKEDAVKRWGPGKGNEAVIDDMIAEGDRVALWGTGRREGKCDLHFCFIVRFSEGKIAETWNMISLQSGHLAPFPLPPIGKNNITKSNVIFALPIAQAGLFVSKAGMSYLSDHLLLRWTWDTRGAA